MRLASNELAAHDAFRSICVAASTDSKIAEMLRSEETIENVVLRALNSTLVTSTTDLRKDAARSASEKSVKPPRVFVEMLGPARRFGVKSVRDLTSPSSCGSRGA